MYRSCEGLSEQAKECQSGLMMRTQDPRNTTAGMRRGEVERVMPRKVVRAGESGGVLIGHAKISDALGT